VGPDHDPDPETIAILWAPQIKNFGGLWSYLQQAFSILVPPIAAIFLVGVFWKRATAKGAFIALLTGHLVGVGLFGLTQVGAWPLHFTVNVTVMTVFSALVLVIVSKMDAPPPAEKVEAGVWRRELALDPALAGAPAWKDPRVHAVLVLLGLVGTIVAFW
jgi:SSS family solute:Na+ symporter